MSVGISASTARAIHGATIASPGATASATSFGAYCASCCTKMTLPQLVVFDKKLVFTFQNAADAYSSIVCTLAATRKTSLASNLRATHATKHPSVTVVHHS